MIIDMLYPKYLLFLFILFNNCTEEVIFLQSSIKVNFTFK